MKTSETKQKSVLVKIILINIAVLVGLFLTIELGLRVVYFSRQCVKTICNYRAFQPINFHDSIDIGYTRRNPILGHTPSPGTFTLNHDKWADVKVTVNEDTTRSNGNPPPPDPDTRILAVGDSFTFGDEVSDRDSWPSFLERKIGVEVVNGGVSGYGFGQALLRAERLASQQDFDLVILTVLIPYDLGRDRGLYVGKNMRPSWIDSGGKITVSYPYRNEELARTLKDQRAHLPHWVGYSFLLSKINRNIFGYHGVETARHPNAGTVEDISCAVIERFSRMPENKILLLHYPRDFARRKRPEIAAHRATG